MICPRWVATPTQPIGVEDIVAYLLAALDRPEGESRIFEIGTDDPVSYGEIMLEYARQRGLRRYLIPVPLLTPCLSSLWLGLMTPVYARVGRKLVESLKNPRTVEVCASPADAFAPIRGIGGTQGWYYMTWLWRIRGWIDLLRGGVGMRRGRTNPELIRAGDTLDFWRVEAYEPDSLLRLEAEMKLPGRAWLEVEVRAGDTGTSTIRQTAVFDPVGLAGLVYWYGIYPLHALIFHGMLHAIAKRACRPGLGEPAVAHVRPAKDG